MDCHFPWDNIPPVIVDPPHPFPPGGHPTIPWEGNYKMANFPTALRFDSNEFGTPVEKTIFGMAMGVDAMPDACKEETLSQEFRSPWLLYSQAGAGSGPGCLRWASDDGQIIPCFPVITAPEDINFIDDNRVTFKYYEHGMWIGMGFWMGSRLSQKWVGPVAFVTVTASMSPNECKWLK